MISEINLLLNSRNTSFYSNNVLTTLLSLLLWIHLIVILYQNYDTYSKKNPKKPTPTKHQTSKLG